MEFLCAMREKECSAPGRELSSLSLGRWDWVRDGSFLVSVYFRSREMSHLLVSVHGGSGCVWQWLFQNKRLCLVVGYMC